uniref:Putative secreted protein n=1 Tax=Anopheles darlingi TaxID=43151 RepID=A0A2M4DBE1_ANODA
MFWICSFFFPETTALAKVVEVAGRCGNLVAADLLLWVGLRCGLISRLPGLPWIAHLTSDDPLPGNRDQLYHSVARTSFALPGGG